ncbi:MAG: STAS domain-containing protein [Planctomycetes bacterium]|nr:STAS domain-containing protein [Planctomycetota bacterium]
MDEKISVEITCEADVAVVIFNATSISDTEKITMVSEQIKTFIEENNISKMVFDFGQVKFFSSQVLGVILDIRSRLEERHGQVVISAINPQLHRVFKITNLDRIFRFFPDRKSAVEAIASN